MERFEAALSAGLGPGGNPNLLLHEFGDVQGRVDLIDAHIRPQSLPSVATHEVLAETLRSPTQARLLSIIRRRSHRTTRYLAKASGLSGRSLRKYLRHLESIGLVEVRGGWAVTLSCELPWDMVDIVAYEGKLTNWRRALHQALGYRSFSRSVWIVMPTTGARLAKRLAPVFHANGIGLIAVDNRGEMRVEIRSRKRRHPRSRRLYLMAVGTVLSRLSRGEVTRPHPP